LLQAIGVPFYPEIVEDASVWPILKWSLGTTVVMAGLTFWLARRREIGRAAWLWAILVLLLGPAGLLLMLCSRGLPVTVRCASCSKGRRVDQGACPHCGAPAPTPARNGTEVFA
jgi:hypothetical protein